MHIRPALARLGASIFTLTICLEATFHWTAFAQSHGNQNVDWVAYIDSVARQDPSGWIAKANEWHLSTGFDSLEGINQGFVPGNVQLSKEDWEAYEAGRRNGRIELEAAQRIFPVEDLPLPLDGADSIEIEVLNDTKGPAALDIVLLQPGGIDWYSTAFFMGNGCFMGKSTFFHKYGASGGGGTLSGIPVVWHNVNLESGTGIWEFDWQVYGRIGDGVQQLGWIPQEINLTNPCVFNRHLNSKIVKTSPLTLRFDWDVDLGMRYRGNSPSLKGSATVRYDWDAQLRRLVPVFLTGNLNAEKMLALDLGAPYELLIHAFAPELKALLRKVGRPRDEAIEFLKEARNGIE